jgi:hypothetical protein
MHARQLGPHSRPTAIAKLDGRTKEAALLRSIRTELSGHVGGAPSPVQRTLIERAARLSLYIELMDKEALAAGTMSERNSRQYLAWNNSLRLCLRELGIRAAPPPAPTLDDIIARHAAEDAAQ